MKSSKQQTTCTLKGDAQWELQQFEMSKCEIKKGGGIKQALGFNKGQLQGI